MDKEEMTSEEILEHIRIEKKYEEALVRAALSDGKEEEEEGFWLRKAMELSQDSQRNPTPEQQARFQERLSAELPKIQAKKRSRASMNRLMYGSCNKAAMILLVVAVGMGALLFSSDKAFAGGVSNFFSRLLDGGEELSITEKEDAGIELDMADFEGMYFPTWIPKGYVIAEAEMASNVTRILYDNNKDDLICYYIYIDGLSVAVDNEEMKETPLFLHDSWGKVLSKEGEATVVWEDAEYIYAVMGSSEIVDELIKVAECAQKVSMED